MDFVLIVALGIAAFFLSFFATLKRARKESKPNSHSAKYGEMHTVEIVKETLTKEKGPVMVEEKNELKKEQSSNSQPVFYESNEGMAAFSVTVKPPTLWGFADENHTIVIDPEYVGVSRFNFGVALVCKPDGSLFFIDKKGNRVSNGNVHGHFDTLEYEERDPDRLYVAECFIFDSGEVIVYGEDTFSYSGRSSDCFYGYFSFYNSRKEFFDLQ